MIINHWWSCCHLHFIQLLRPVHIVTLLIRVHMNQPTISDHVTDHVHPRVFTVRRVAVLHARVAHARLLHCVCLVIVHLQSSDAADTTRLLLYTWMSSFIRRIKELISRLSFFKLLSSAHLASSFSSSFWMRVCMVFSGMTEGSCLVHDSGA